MHTFIGLWPYFLSSLVLSVLFLLWKSSGGNLLFRDKPTDDPTTRLFKGVFAMGWALGSGIVAFLVAALSFVILLIEGVCALFR